VVDGDEVRIQMQGSISGDILIFISPRQALAEGQSTLSLVVSDSSIENQLQEVMKQFRTKFRGLYLLPQGIAWFINIIFISLITWRFYQPVIMAFSAHDISEALSFIAPPAVIAALAAVFSKEIGFGILKPLLTVIKWVVQFVRRKKNKPVS
jgi:hypothetical protein